MFKAKKTKLSVAVAVILNLSVSQSFALEIPINDMVFNSKAYNTTGSLTESGNGNISSIEPLFDIHWTATQQTLYLDNTDSWDGISSQGPFDYSAEISAMDKDQIAVGIFLNWSRFDEIPILEIFDCDANILCRGNGVAMGTGPFVGSTAIFNAGLSCKNTIFTTQANTPININIAVDVLANDTTVIAKSSSGASNCSNPAVASGSSADIINPPGLTVTDVNMTSVKGGSISFDNTAFIFIPAIDTEGLDSFNFTATDDTGMTTTTSVEVFVGDGLSNFTMLRENGGLYAGTNDVLMLWDEINFNSGNTNTNLTPTDTNFGLMTLYSPEPFLNFNWVAHHVRVFEGPSLYKFDVTCKRIDYKMEIVDCNRPLTEQNATQQYITMKLETGEIGAHILFDWGKDDSTTECGLEHCNIDIINVWKQNSPWDTHGDKSPKNQIWTGPKGSIPFLNTSWRLTSIDPDGDGINGTKMIDGPLKNSSANFNYNPMDTQISVVTESNSSSSSINIFYWLTAILLAVTLRRSNTTKSKSRGNYRE